MLTSRLFGKMTVKSLFRVEIILLLLIASSDANFLDWVWGGSQDVQDVKLKPGEVPAVKIPFEVNTEDEKFLEEAKKYTSLKLSDLDSCQHHIVMQIRNSCADMTEEDLAKMSVNLLNCQSSVEGRQQFPCTKKMSLRECTSAMDSDMWNTYHLMNNRARAVCYAARHQQFRALSEMTVNKLMDSAAHQLDTMNTLKEGQQKLESMTTHTMEKLSVGHKDLLNEQEKLHTTQRSLQDFVTLNLRTLTREKALIAAGQQELLKLSSVVNRLELNTEDILLELDGALNKLVQINATISFLLDMMEKTHQELDKRLGWMSNLIGGTGEQLDRLFSCVLHGLYLVVGMVTASFVRAPTLSRACLVVMVPLNLAVAYHQGDAAALNFPSMTVLLVTSAAVHWLIQAARQFCGGNQAAPVYYLQGTAASPTANGFVQNSSPVRPVPSLSSRLREFVGKTVKSVSAMVSSWRWHGSGKPLQSSLHDESSDTDDVVVPSDNFPERLINSTYGTSEYLRAHSGTPTLRQRSSTPMYNIPPTPTRTSSRSGTPTPRPICRAICRNGQPCRNSAAADSLVCRRHTFDSSFSAY